MQDHTILAGTSTHGDHQENTLTQRLCGGTADGLPGLGPVRLTEKFSSVSNNNRARLRITAAANRLALPWTAGFPECEVTGIKVRPWS